MFRIRVPLVLAASLSVHSVSAAPPNANKAQCIADSESAQALRDEHKLIRARELFLACAKDSCPSVIRKDCAASVLDLEKKIPSLVIRATTDDGADLVAVKVMLDGEVVLSSLDGKALPIDPGVHRVRLEAEGFPANEQQIVVTEGELNRALLVTFAKPKPLVAKPTPPSAPLAQPVPTKTNTGALVLGGLGLAALAGGGVFYGIGLSERSREIDAGCATQSACDDAKSSIRTKLIVGDVLIGVGAVSVIGSIVWLIASNKTSSEVPKNSVTSLDVRPLTGGAFATASFAF